MKRHFLLLVLLAGLFGLIEKRSLAHPGAYYGDGYGAPRFGHGGCYDDYTWRRYPQWYYGFSGRYLQNIARPTGDQGLRDTAW